MKKNQIRLLLLFIFIISGSYSASAQIIVGVRPPPPIIVRPPRPSRAHVWINEDWEPKGKEYKYAAGHWANPPHPGQRWKKGRWKKNHGGNVWVGGGWRRGKYSQLPLIKST